MDWQPDTDSVDGQVQAQLEEQAGEGQVRHDEEAAEKPGPAASKAPVDSTPPGSSTLESFFRILGATLVATRPRQSSADRKDHAEPQEARENVKQALIGLRELQTEDEGGPRYRYVHIVAPVALVAVAVSVMLLFPGSPQTLSPQLIGSWQTSATKYADRTLELSENEIAFEQGPARGFARYPISEVTWRREAGGALVYVIKYVNADVTHQFSFIHQPVTNTITLKNQALVVWTKAGN